MRLASSSCCLNIVILLESRLQKMLLTKPEEKRKDNMAYATAAAIARSNSSVI